MSAEHQASPKETFDVQAMGRGNTAPAVLHSALAEWLYHERSSSSGSEGDIWWASHGYRYNASRSDVKTALAGMNSAPAESLYHERMIHVFQWFGEWILFVEEWETPGTTSICQRNPNPWNAVKDGNLYIPGDSVLSGMDYYGKVFMKDNVRKE